MNESIDAIITSVTVEQVGDDGETRPVITDIEGLRTALVSRDDTILDTLRQMSMAQGLRPSITQLMLIQTGLGEQPSPEQVALLENQAAREIAELQQAHMFMSMLMQRYQQEGGG